MPEGTKEHREKNCVVHAFLRQGTEKCSTLAMIFADTSRNEEQPLTPCPIASDRSLKIMSLLVCGCKYCQMRVVLRVKPSETERVLRSCEQN